MRDIQADVRQFMAAFDQEMPDSPQWPDQKTMDLRVRLKAEEFCEFLRDSGYNVHLAITRFAHACYAGGGVAETEVDVFVDDDGEPSIPSLPKSADALIDEIYVNVGTLLAMGIDFWPLWEAVQRANMAKVGGPIVNGKVSKPAGWSPPDIDALLKDQGWEG